MRPSKERARRELRRQTVHTGRGKEDTCAPVGRSAWVAQIFLYLGGLGKRTTTQILPVPPATEENFTRSTAV